MTSSRATTKTPTPRTRTRNRRRRTEGSEIFKPGTQIGAYEIQEPIGRGGMGVVYRAHHKALDRVAAIKVLKALEHDPEAARRFEREARTSAQLRHPNILNVFDYGEIAGTPYMVTEYLPGGTLADRLRQTPPADWPQTLGLLRGIAAALDFAHAQNVIHRDIKPGNILLDDKGNAVLADFGLAKVLRESTLTTTGIPTGTPAYVAPEQITEAAVGPAADRYSFAVMAYQLLTGRLPFTAADFMKALYAHVQQEPARPSRVAPHLPKALDLVLLRGLAKTPEFRWDTCSEMVEAIEAALAGGPVGASADVLDTAAAEATLTRMFTETPELSTPWVRRASEVREALSAERGRFKLVRRIPTPVLALVTPVAAFAIGFLLFVGLAALLRPVSGSNSGAGASVPAVQAGRKASLTMTGLPKSRKFQLYLSGLKAAVGSGTADAAGRTAVQFAVPAGTTAGVHELKACWSSRCAAITRLDVIAAEPPPKPAPAPNNTSADAAAIGLPAPTPAPQDVSADSEQPAPSSSSSTAPAPSPSPTSHVNSTSADGV